MESPALPGACHRGTVRTHDTIHLLRELVRRDFRARFTGTALGLFWAILQPLSLVLLYWFVFTFMFRTPFAQRGGFAAHGYVEFLVAGLLPWIGLNEGILRSTTSIVDNASIVRRLAMRSELLPVVPNVSALIHQAIGLALFTLFLLVRGQSLRLLWCLPIALILQLAVQLGLGWMLAASYVFFRDLVPILGFVLSVLFYLSPILYPVQGRFEWLFAWNPLTPLLGLFRSALLGVPLPAGGSLVFLLCVTVALFAGGLFFFRRAQATLADLI